MREGCAGKSMRVAFCWCAILHVRAKCVSILEHTCFVVWTWGTPVSLLELFDVTRSVFGLFVIF